MEPSTGWPQRGDPLSRQERLAVVGLVVGAAALRSVSWMQTAVLFNDGPLFLHMARSFAVGDLASALAHPYHPLYPALVALVQPLLGGWESAAVLVSVVGGALAVGALFAFLRASFGPREALIGAFLLAVHPWTIQFSADVQSEGLYLAFFLAALACLWQALLRASWLGALGAGAFTGLAYLTRPEGLIVAAVGVAIGLGAVVRRRLPPLRAAGLAALAAVALVASAAPYVLLLHEQTGEWLLTRKKVVGQIIGIEAYRGPVQTRATSYDEPQLPPLDPPAGSESALAAGSSGTPSLGAAAVTVLDTGQSVLRPDMLLLLLLGIWGARGRPGLRGALVAGLVASYAVVLVGLEMNAGYLSRRHALPPLVATFGYAALGVEMLAVAGARLRVRGLLGRPGRVTLLLLALVGAGGLGKALKPHRSNGIAERQAAEWLQSQDPAAGIVAARRRRVAYYASARFLLLPERIEGRTLEQLRRRGVRYLILDDAKQEEYPGFREAVPHFLRPIHQAQGGGRAASVYELVPHDPGG